MSVLSSIWERIQSSLFPFAVYNSSTTRELLDRLQSDKALRRICGGRRGKKARPYLLKSRRVVFGKLKDESGGRMVRIRGSTKVMAHLMFCILALTADQLLKFVQ